MYFRRVHEKSHRKHQCNVCEKRCGSMYQLKRHQLTHSSIKPFSCNLCEAAYKDKTNLTIHLRNVHNVHKDKQEETQNNQLEYRVNIHNYK